MGEYIARGECLNCVAYIAGKIRGLHEARKLMQAEIDRLGAEVERLRNETADMREKIARLEGLHGKGGRQWT
jgi:prefoldin subunit 5